MSPIRSRHMPSSCHVGPTPRLRSPIPSTGNSVLCDGVESVVALASLAEDEAMPLNLNVGDRFPDVTMTDDRGQVRPISDVVDGQPLFLAFFRGPW